MEPPVDGDGLDTADREEAAAGAGTDAHGEHALEQSLALAPAVMRILCTLTIMEAKENKISHMTLWTNLRSSWPNYYVRICSKFS